MINPVLFAASLVITIVFYFFYRYTRWYLAGMAEAQYDAQSKWYLYIFGTFFIGIFWGALRWFRGPLGVVALVPFALFATLTIYMAKQLWSYRAYRCPPPRRRTPR